MDSKRYLKLRKLQWQASAFKGVGYLIRRLNQDINPDKIIIAPFSKNKTKNRVLFF